MTGKQNNSIVEIKPNELVQHKNKFKSIAIYKEEQYESTVELVNENYKEQALTLSTSSDGNDTNKLYVTAELAKDPKSVVSYEWKVVGVDGITNLIDEKDANFSVDNNELTIKNQWDIKKFITIQAFAYNSNGIYIASSDILTVYEKDANLISAITVDFSKDHVVIPEGITDSASIQTLTTTTVTVYRGEDNITSTCTYNWSTKDGTTNLINNNLEAPGGNVNGIQIFESDTDELKVRIEVPKTTTTGKSIILEKIMPISRGGNVVYSIIPSTGVINITKMNMEQDYTFTMQQLTTAGGATTLEVLPTGHSLAWQYINKNGIAIGEKASIGAPTSGVWTFKYNPNSKDAAGFSIILSDSQGDIVDSEQITFIQDGVDYTGLILAASSQVFSTSDPSTATITLTAQLYGDLVGETVSWYLGNNTTPDANGSNPYVLGINELSGKTSLKVRAEAGNGEYFDTITIYKLNDAITAFFTNELMTFSADALGMVGSQDKPVAFTSNIKVFQGITDVTNKITNISLTSISSLSNVVITPAYPTESNPDTVPSVTVTAKGTNFGTSEITSGKFSFIITVDGIGDIPLDLSWIKIPAPNGINNIEEYYQATATNEAPNQYSDADKKIIDEEWKATIIDAGQTKEKPYLWNFERIKKDNGDLLRDTDVSLLSSSPRTIISTTEYYTTNTTGIIPVGATYNDADAAQTGNDAPKIDATVWKTVEPTLAPGEYLYNFEVVQYAAVDANNKNLYTWTEPVQIGYAGEDGSDGEGIKYKYCLRNSSTKPVYPAPAKADYTWTDEPTGVSQSNQYEYVISIITSPIVTVAKKINTQLREYDEEAWRGYGAPGHEENWTIRGTGPFDNSHIHLQDYAYVEGIITDSDPVQSVKLYGKVIGLTQSSTFGGNVRMRSEFLMIGDQITSDVALWAKWGNDGVDYTALIISGPQTFIKNPNVNDNPITPPSATLTPNLYGDLVGKTVTWKQGTTTITSTSSSSNIYKSGNNLIVKSGAFGANNTLTFTASVDGTSYNDDYSVYLLSEGSNAYSAYLTDQSWSFSADQDGKVAADIEKTTTVKIFKGANEITSGVGIKEVGGSLNNYGKFTYSNISPTLTFKSNNSNSNFGSSSSSDGQITITAVADEKEFTLGLSWDKTNTGTDAYSISLSKESAILECDPTGGYDSTELQSISKVKATVMHGSADISDNQEIRYQWDPKYGVISSTTAQEIYFIGIDADTATATLTVNKEGKSLGTKTFTVTKNKQIPGESVYLFPSVTSITKTGDEYSPSSFTIQAMKKVGSNPPEQLTGYWYNVTIDDTPETMWYLLDGKKTINLGGSGYNPNKRLYIKLYPNENHNEQELVDAKTISIMPEPLSEYVLYNDDRSGTPYKPEFPSYSDYLPAKVDAYGWYAIQDEKSIWESKKSSYPSKEATDPWGAPVRVSGTLTNYSDLYKALEEVENNADGVKTGIYTLPNEKIGVSADVIKAGAINVGGFIGEEINKNKFYVDMNPEKPTYMAGWEITNISIKSQNNLGADDSFHMRTADLATEENKVSIGGSDPRSDWRLGIGSNFGVTKDGVVYATAGKIGNVSIGNIASTKINPNLFIGSTNDDYWTSSTGTLGGTNGEYWITWNGTTGGGVEKFIYHQPFGVTKGKTYTLSFDAKKTDNLSSSEVFILQSGFEESGQFVLNWAGFSDQLTQEYKRFSHTFTVPYYEGNMADCDLRFDHNGSTNGEDATLWVRNIKLEEGTEATAWSLAPEDIATTAHLNVLNESINAKVGNSQTNKEVNWEMTDSAFTVTAQNGMDIGGITVDKNGLTVTGTIYATDGEINGDLIVKNSIAAEKINTEGLSAEYIQSDNYTPEAGTESALNFTLVEDHYKVGLKTTDIPSEVLIPEKYNGKPVTELDVETFAAGKEIIQKLAIPAGITTNPFGLLKDYTELVELHIPVHQTPPNPNVSFINLSNYFGSVGYGDSSITPPLKIEKVYLAGSENNNTIPRGYFDFEYWVESFDFYIPKVYITPSIPLITSESLLYHCVNEIYYYNDTQINFTEEKISKTNEIYKYPGAFATTGFRITSKEDYPMIDSPNFQVDQDGTVYAKAGMIGGVAIGDIATGEQVTKITQETISTTNILAQNLQVNAANIKEQLIAEQINTTGLKAETIQSSNYEKDKTGFKITSAQDKNMIDSLNFKVTQNGDITANNVNISGIIHAEEGGNIGAFKIANNGLESDYIKLNAQNIDFPTQTNLTLSDDVILGSTDEEVYIRSQGKKLFTICNAIGAGIQFYPQEQIQTGGCILILTPESAEINNWEQEHETEIRDETDGYNGVTWYISKCHFIPSITFNYEWKDGKKPHYIPNNIMITLRYSARFDSNSNYEWFNQNYKLDIPVDNDKGSITIQEQVTSIMHESQTEFIYWNEAHCQGVFSQTMTGDADQIYGNNLLFTPSIEVFNTYQEQQNLILFSLGSFIPNTDATDETGLFLGDAGHRWNTVETIHLSQSSDKNIKKDIIPLNDERYSVLFDQLKPTIYKFKAGLSQRNHTGFIAQEVKEALDIANIDSQDFAAYCDYEREDGTHTYSLRYTEFIPLNTWQIQKLKARVKQAEETIELQNTYIKNLEERLERLEQKLL